MTRRQIRELRTGDRFRNLEPLTVCKVSIPPSDWRVLGSWNGFSVVARTGKTYAQFTDDSLADCELIPRVNPPQFALTDDRGGA